MDGLSLNLLIVSDYNKKLCELYYWFNLYLILHVNIEEAKEKYLGSLVRHKFKPFLLFVANVYEFEGEIKASFSHLYYRSVPIGMPVSAVLDGLEKDWEIIPVF